MSMSHCGERMKVLRSSKWIEHPTGVWEVIGSNPVGDLIFSLSRARDMLIISFSRLFHRA